MQPASNLGPFRAISAAIEFLWPAELPIEQLTKIYVSINLRTAKGLGITVPQELLLRADELIQ